MGDEGGLVALAAVRDGREEGGVSFDEDAVEWGERGGFADVGRARVSQVSGERQVEAEGKGAFGVGGAGGVGMSIGSGIKPE